jgi:DNA-directed RNA polymerase subunit H (RpoH/RPB5)
VSDKETAPWIKKAVEEIQLRNRMRGHVIRAVRSGETADVMTSKEMEQIIAEMFEKEIEGER